MNKLFIDTNAFYKLGYNFDIRNPIINILIENAKNLEYEYNNLSIIDNEIISDLKDRGECQEKQVNKMRWISKHLTEDILKKNCYKDLNDYKNFKNKIGGSNCDVSNINPEDIFRKYFDVKLPFEKRDLKRKEFPDAFISAYINDLEVIGKDKIYLITDDKGLAKSIENPNVVIFHDIESFLSDINNISPLEYNKMCEFINNNKEIIAKGILNKSCINTNDLEREEISVDSIKIQDIMNIEVMSDEDDVFLINCTCDFLVLKGEFICFDYYNSYMPNDCDFYVNEEYIRTEEIPFEQYEFMITLKKDGNDYIIEFMDIYNFELYFDLMCDAYAGQIENYVDGRMEPHDDYR